MWPTFIAVTLVDGLILHLLPPIGTGVDLIPAILLATFGNLILIGAVAPWLARRTWDRNPGAGPQAPPRARLEVLADRIGTATSIITLNIPIVVAALAIVLMATIVGVTAAGLAARPTVVSETEDTERNAKAFRELILNRGDEELIHNLETANTVRLSEDFFRTCVARKDRRHYFCAFIDTSKNPPDVDVDGSAEPNSVFKLR